MKLSSTKLRPTMVSAVVGVAVALLVSWLSVAAAGAHDGDAVIEVDAAHPATGSIHYIVAVTWEDDGHPAVGAAVSARATSPEGEVGEIVTFSPQGDEEDGLYQGTVDMAEPGEWTVLFSALNPGGDLEHSEIVEAPAEPEAPPAGDDAESDELAEPLEPEVYQTNEEAELTAEPGEGDDSDDGVSLPVLLAVFAVLAAAVAAVFWFVMKGKSAPGEAADSDGSDASADEPDESDQSTDSEDEAGPASTA